MRLNASQLLHESNRAIVGSCDRNVLLPDIGRVNIVRAIVGSRLVNVTGSNLRCTVPTAKSVVYVGVGIEIMACVRCKEAEEPPARRDA